MANADFHIKTAKIGILRGCLEDCSSSPHTIGTGRYYESHWKDGWTDVINILEQIAGRNQHLERAEETRTVLRLRKLLQTATEDTIFTAPSAGTRTIHVPIPNFGDSWPQYHAAVGSGAGHEDRLDPTAECLETSCSGHKLAGSILDPVWHHGSQFHAQCAHTAHAGFVRFR